jgi:hypothetical protein
MYTNASILQSGKDSDIDNLRARVKTSTRDGVALREII